MDSKNQITDTPKMALLFKFEGIPTRSDVPGHENWARIGSMQFGVGRGISMGRNHYSGEAPPSEQGPPKREIYPPSVSEICITRKFDPGFVATMKEALGNRFSQAAIRLVDLNDGQIHVIAEYVLDEVAISGYSISASPEGAHESISLNYARIRMDSPQANDRVVYDILNNKIE